MKIRSMTALALVLLLAGFVAACSDSTTAASTVSSIAVTGTVPGIGGASQFTATATMSSGTTQDVTSLAAWTSSNPADAAVSSSGVVTGVAAGPAVINATYSSVTGSDSITVP
jgi:Big-like domain-containing protein